MSHSTEKSEISSRKIAKLLNREPSKNVTEKRVILFILFLLGDRMMEAYAVF